MERTQRCRHCCYLETAGVIRCTERDEIISRAAAESPNRCHSFAYTPVDAFGGESGDRPRKRGKKQCEGQMKFF